MHPFQPEEGAFGEEGLGKQGGVFLREPFQDGQAPVQLSPHPVPQGEEEAEAGGGVRHPLGVAEEGLHLAPFQEGPSRPLQGPEEEPTPVAPGGLQGLFPGLEGEGGLEEPPGRFLGRQGVGGLEVGDEGGEEPEGYPLGQGLGQKGLHRLPKPRPAEGGLGEGEEEGAEVQGGKEVLQKGAKLGGPGGLPLFQGLPGEVGPAPEEGVDGPGKLLLPQAAGEPPHLLGGEGQIFRAQAVEWGKPGFSDGHHLAREDLGRGLPQVVAARLRAPVPAVGEPLGLGEALEEEGLAEAGGCVDQDPFGKGLLQGPVKPWAVEVHPSG
ncbi:hypothetical protein TTMY_1483 [Thermus thermophilus]|nr:hypothetical protein TTMY_1483 [Thermus thermophilus]